jgi:hypothetical protein
VYGRNNLPVNLPTRSPRLAKIFSARAFLFIFSGMATAQSIIPPSNPLCGFQPLAQPLANLSQQQALNGKQHTLYLWKSYWPRQPVYKKLADRQVYSSSKFRQVYLDSPFSEPYFRQEGIKGLKNRKQNSLTGF